MEALVDLVVGVCCGIGHGVVSDWAYRRQVRLILILCWRLGCIWLYVGILIFFYAYLLFASRLCYIDANRFRFGVKKLRIYE